VIVGVNRWTTDEEELVELQQIDPEAERRQCARTAEVRAGRDAGAVAEALGGVRRAAAGDENLLPAMRSALAAHATIGEVCDVLREQWGTFDAVRPPG
jgi:methylmalonyl-CoA mutase N-terminal domain/subunit